MVEVHLQPRCLYASKAKQEHVCPASWSLWLAGGQPRLSLPREKMERKSASSCSEQGLVVDVEALLGEPGKRRSRFCLCGTCRENTPCSLASAGGSCFPRRPGPPCGEGHACTSRVSVGTGVGCWETGILQTLLISSNCQLSDVLISTSLH